MKLCTSESQFIKHAARPSFISFKKFSEDLIAVHKVKETLKLNKPVYVGVAILDLSKVLMYDFHYDWTKHMYEEKQSKGDQEIRCQIEIRHKNYMDDLFGGGVMRHTMNKITSDHHKLTTNKVTKVSLSSYDDKRWIREDGVCSYAYGHWRIPDL